MKKTDVAVICIEISVSLKLTEDLLFVSVSFLAVELAGYCTNSQLWDRNCIFLKATQYLLNQEQFHFVMVCTLVFN